MSQLSHAEAAWQVQVVQARQVLLMMLGCAQLADGATTQREVDPSFDGERVVTQRKHFQTSHELAWICKFTWKSGPVAF